MKKYIKLVASVFILSAITFLVFQRVLANKIKIVPAIEVVNKYNDIAKNGLYCPRTISPEEPLNSQVVSETTEYEHCTSCKMGVFFKNKDGELSCSFCLISKP